MYLTLAAGLASVRVTQVVPIFKARRSHEEVWHCERPGEAIGEGAASAAAEGLGLKAPSREAEAWPCEESPEEAIGKRAAHGQQEMPVPRMTTKNSSSRGVYAAGA